MKLFLLAAAAVVSTSALAQSGTMSTAPQSGTAMPDAATTTTTTAPASDGTTVTSTTTATPMGTMTSTNVQMGGMMGGAGVAPQPIAAPQPVNPDPPVCRKGQFDGCKNGPGATHSREVRGRS